MRLLLLATVGGGIGAGARYLVQTGMVRWLGAGFPWWTFAINIVGSLLMGLVVTLVAARYDNSAEIRTFLATGILGGFTTFSAFSLDVANLVDNKQTAAAAFYVAGSVGLSILALYAGIALAKAALS
jgi:fluoride exporter